MNSSTLDLRPLRDAVTALQEALAVVGDEAWFDRQSPSVRNTLLAGVIKSFEFVYEIGVKMLKRRIYLDAANPSEVDALNYRDLLRVAGETGLVSDVPAWFNYRQMRNITALTYDHDKGREIVGFLADAKDLLARLAARNG